MDTKNASISSEIYFQKQGENSKLNILNAVILNRLKTYREQQSTLDTETLKGKKKLFSFFNR